MTDHDAHAELVATAQRIAAGWTVGPEGPAELLTNPHLAELSRAGYARFVYTPAYQRADDYWTLTDEGVRWLAEAADDAA